MTRNITILPADGGGVRVKVNGVDVFDPVSGKVQSDGPDGIVCWFNNLGDEVMKVFRVA